MVIKKEETREFMELVHEASGFAKGGTGKNERGHEESGVKKGKSQAPPKKEMQKESIAPMSQKKETDIEKILVENFVSLQKVMTNLAVKFDGLSDQISKLLELFEISAKTLAEKGYSSGEDKKIVEKLDSLLEHNKVIAKGIALLHERNMPEEQEMVIMPSQPSDFANAEKRFYSNERGREPIQPPQRPAPRMPPQQMRPMGTENRFPRPNPQESSKPRFTQEA